MAVGGGGTWGVVGVGVACATRPGMLMVGIAIPEPKSKTRKPAMLRSARPMTSDAHGLLANRLRREVGGTSSAISRSLS